MGQIAENLARIRARIEEAARAAGRDPAGVRLIAVSKTHPASAIREAFGAGQRDFGENYVQELRAKAADLADLDGIVFHAIGGIQRNKVKDVVRVARVVHTVDREELALEIDKRAESPIDVLLEVNVAREPQKAGCAPERAGDLAGAVAALPNLRLVGLMAIPPESAEPSASRRWFAALRELRDAVAKEHPRCRELSMGMSHDFGEAIAEGATMVRVGTAIFGARPPKPER
jgi:pyridoxal phosphate enzyme (YggS family)